MRAAHSDRVLETGIPAMTAIFSAWYLFDAWRARASVENLILIAPVSILVLALCFAEIILVLAGKRRPKSTERGSARDLLPAILLFAGYVFSLEFIGFDIGTILFVGLFLRLHGEIRWHWIILYSLLFGLLVPYFFAMMLPYPMPMTLLPTDY